MSGAPVIIGEVHEFLAGLRHDFPEVFRVERPKGRRIPFRGGSVERPPVPAHELKDWYVKRLGEILPERLAFWSGKIGVSFSRVSIKNQRSRWASCSRKGRLSFNWRLILAPPDVLDYVVIHELCHLLEMNHSKRYWRHVTAWCPGHKTHRRWLRVNGRGLGRGPSHILDVEEHRDRRAHSGQIAHPFGFLPIPWKEVPERVDPGE